MAKDEKLSWIGSMGLVFVVYEVVGSPTFQLQWLVFVVWFSQCYFNYSSGRFCYIWQFINIV